MRTNKYEPKPTVLNHEGAKAKLLSPAVQLRRAVLCSLLGEKTFYESGQSISERIALLVPMVDPMTVASIAIEARNVMGLRHVPLLLVREMVKHPRYRPYVRKTLSNVVQRPDELSEFLAMYFDKKKQPVAASVKKGLADAFERFDEHTLAKYDRDNPVKLRDVMFLVHPSKVKGGTFTHERKAKPVNRKGYKRSATSRSSDTLYKLSSRSLDIPETWEVIISAPYTKENNAKWGATKSARWNWLVDNDMLGGLATLRNLNNMTENGVSVDKIVDALNRVNTKWIFPFRYVAANIATKGKYEKHLESLVLRSMRESGIRLRGKTIVLIDVSGSMEDNLSDKSDMTRMDAAAALGVIVNELADTCTVKTFSHSVRDVNNPRGLSGVSAIIKSQQHGGTELAYAIDRIRNSEVYDRLIVITDEQAQDANYFNPHRDKNTKNYIINVAPYRSSMGVQYVQGESVGAPPAWVSISGFSEAVIRYISEMESIDYGDKSR